MVQLSPSSPCSDSQLAHDLKNQSERGIISLSSSLPASATPLQVYETYIENGCVSLKHKIRNIEKKKVKLEDYRDRLRNGEALNQDQQEAVSKYDEVLHNLEFAKELQKTFAALGQDLIKAQKKAMRREQVQRLEAEKKRLRMVLQIQYLLQTFCREHVQKDFKDGLNGAMFLNSKELESMTKFAKMICHKRFKHMSLEDEMDQSALYFWNLLEGNEKTVATSNYKSLKELIGRMLDCGYFESVPDPPPEKKPEEKPKEPPQIELNKLAKTELVKEQESFVEYMKSDLRELTMRPTLLKNDLMTRPTEVPKLGEVKYVKQEAMKAWPAATLVKVEEPKRWPSPPQLSPMTKQWEAVKSTPQPSPAFQRKYQPESLMPLKCEPVQLPKKYEPEPIKVLKKCEPEAPKERRERPSKLNLDSKCGSQIKEVKASLAETTPKKRDIPAPICINHHSPAMSNSQKHSSPQPHRVLSQPAAEFCSSPTLPKDPELRKQRIDDLIDEIKGTYNFMQDSMLDFEFPSPKIVSPQRPQESLPDVSIEPLPSLDPVIKLPPAPVEPKIEVSLPAISPEPAALPSPVRSPINVPASPVHEVESLSAEKLFVTSPLQATPLPERNLTPVNLPTSQIQSPVISSSHIQSPVISSSHIPSPVISSSHIQSPVSLSNGQIQSPVNLSSSRINSPVNIPSSHIQSPRTPTNISVLQQEEPRLSARSTPISAHSSPFHGMQAVFKVNAPLPPPRKEPDIRDDPPYPPEYQQTYSTASTQTTPHGLLDAADHHSIIQEPLTGPYGTSTSSPMGNGSLPCYTSSPNLMPRLPQPCMTTRGGTVRGTSRGGRIMSNGYRCPTAFKGPDNFRGSPCIANGSYGHSPCPGRDFPVTQFMPRDGSSHLCHKRGSISSGTRSTRSWNDSQLSSPEREESFNSTDSGQGDSRTMTTMTSMDMSMSSQPATILPVHVYPLPQQIRVAFSAARTSNFAPGTLDQPIIFDLLLNNLGDTFDFQIGRFLCPVNGTYVFIFHMLKLAVNVPLYVNLMKNDEVMVSAYANDGAPDHETASNHAVLQLYQGDQIWLRLHRGAIYGSSWKYSTFSGYLLYPD